MVCADTNCIIAWLAGEDGADVEFLGKMLQRKSVVLAPVVIAELLSDPALPEAAAKTILAMPQLEIQSGYWQRAGKLRALLAARGLRARLADTLIAQSCIDHGSALLTRDKGFGRFADAGLNLV